MEVALSLSLSLFLHTHTYTHTHTHTHTHCLSLGLLGLYISSLTFPGNSFLSNCFLQANSAQAQSTNFNREKEIGVAVTPRPLTYFAVRQQQPMPKINGLSELDPHFALAQLIA